MVYWPTNAAGFNLQFTTNLNARPAWTPVSIQPVTISDQNVVVEPLVTPKVLSPQP
jgi:hypothetical protein